MTRKEIVANAVIKKAQFADLLAEGIDPTNAAKRLGWHGAYGRVIFQRMCKELGAQAI